MTPARTISPEQKAAYARLFEQQKRLAALQELVQQALIESASLLQKGPGPGGGRLQRVQELTSQIHALRGSAK